MLLVAALIGYWLLPISGQVIVMTNQGAAWPWPHMQMQPGSPRPGQKVTAWITDNQPWSHVNFEVNGAPARLEEAQVNAGNTWTWQWSFTAPDTSGYALTFYHDCHTGCQTRGLWAVGGGAASPDNLTPTKLGVVFPNPNRDWHGRQGWGVELTYAQLADEESWGLDALATRVQQDIGRGLRVLVRVDYAPGQSLPPVGDEVALADYLAYVRRLARDDRLTGVYGYIIGSGYNTLDGNRLNPQNPVTPAWYARIFNGYGQPVQNGANIVQIIRAVNPQVKVLAGPIQPWNSDQNGELAHAIDMPWLNYMNTLAALLNESAQTKAAAGIPLTAPDGFAVQAPGNPAAPELAGQPPAQEPELDLARTGWNGAQPGFGVFRDWLDIINQYETTQNLPVYITSTNTFAASEGIPPAQNYPAGWLTSALDVVNQNSQIVALCWFMDNLPDDTQWQQFSLTGQSGQVAAAAEEFDALLQK